MKTDLKPKPAVNIKSIKIQKKVASLNFDWKNKIDVLTKELKELKELKEAIKKNNKKDIIMFINVNIDDIPI
jgi:uncharacterized protein YabN with tetrapyrrole methylase and pyrophosphatase domain